MADSRVRRVAAGVVFALVALSALGVAGWWWLAADRRYPARPTQVVVDQGLTMQQIGELLARQGVVSSATGFKLAVRLRQPAPVIQSARYDIPAHVSIEEALDRLVRGGHAIETRVVIPEGYTAQQVGQRLQDAGLTTLADFMTVVHHTELRFGDARTRGLEGYLFPDTYLVPKGARASEIATQMTDQFRRRLPKDAESSARRLHRAIPDVITIASLVEREAKVDDERPLIAAVIYNRLARGMLLQIDATIEYALPHHKAVLSFGDLALDSPYNTYRYPGLPPTPIANPGARAIWAAFHPATVGYLYYVYKGGGRHQFSDTIEQQKAAEKRYLR